MEQRDLIMQHIEQLGRVLGKLYADLMGLKSNGRISEGMEITNQALNGALKLDTERIIELGPDEFIEGWMKEGSYSVDNAEKLCDSMILAAEGLDMNDEKRIKYLSFCIQLLEHLEQLSGEYSMGRRAKISTIHSMLSP